MASLVSRFHVALARAVPPSAQNSSPTSVPLATVLGTLRTASLATRLRKRVGGWRRGETGSRSRPGRGGGGLAQLIFPRGFLVGVQIDVDWFGNDLYAVLIQYVGK